MLFNSFQFAIFFVLVVVLHRSLPRAWQGPLLLGASLLFYMLWHPAYLLLLLTEIAINYVLLRWMARSARPRVQLVLACSFTLGLLAWYKYAVLLIGTALEVFGLTGSGLIRLPEIFLPLGISFYSFQILALTIDTYRGQIAPVESFSRYALFVSFFPQLIAGPILRGRQFLPQLEQGGDCTRERTQRGLFLIAVGLGKKVVMADMLLAPFVDEVFKLNAPAVPSFHWLAAYSFLFQVYFDFSGYCDMARGTSLLLGFELPLNFSEPYLSRSPFEFWQRWHITLSRWLSDYLFVPLGGNRTGRLRSGLNLMLTMVLGGLWHGASWTFALWGAVHGVFLILHRLLVRRPADPNRPLSLADVPRILVVFNVCAVAQAIFRSADVAQALHFIEVLFTPRNPYAWPWLQTAIVLFCVALHPAERWLRLNLPALQRRLDGSGYGAALQGASIGAILGLCLMAAGVGGDFIYFQF